MSINSEFVINCLFCLAPLTKYECIFSINEDIELIEFLVQSHSSEIKSISPLYFHQAYSSAYFCKICHDQLTEIKLIAQEIKKLENKMQNLSTVLSDKLLSTHKNYDHEARALKKELHNISFLRKLLYQVQNEENKISDYIDIEPKIESDIENFIEDNEARTHISESESFDQISQNLEKETDYNLDLLSNKDQNSPSPHPYSTDPFNKVLKVTLQRLSLPIPMCQNKNKSLIPSYVGTLIPILPSDNLCKYVNKTALLSKNLNLELQKEHNQNFNLNEQFTLKINENSAEKDIKSDKENKNKLSSDDAVEKTKQKLEDSQNKAQFLVSKRQVINNPHNQLESSNAAQVTEIESFNNKTTDENCASLNPSSNFQITREFAKLAKNHHKPLFICLICARKFKSQLSLDQHLKNHARNFMCSICSNIFSSKFSLKRHEDVLHPNEKKTESSSNIDASAKKMNAENINRSQIESQIEEPLVLNSSESKSTSSAAHVIERIDEIIGENTNIIESSLPTKSTLKPSVSSKKDASRFICHICAKIFRTQQVLDEHLQHHNRIFICSFCSKKCPSNFSLKVHESRHLQAEKNPSLKCPHCEKSFLFKSKLSQHLLFVHNTFKADEERKKKNKEKIRCELCAYITSTPAFLKYHMAEIHRQGENELKFPCELCGKRFLNQHGLTAHKRGVHFKPQEFLCSACGKKSTSESNLRSHFIRCHTQSQKREFKCSYCDKYLATLNSKETHERIHTKDFPYQCPKCVKKYPTQFYLNRHFIIHTGRFTCPICSKGFKSSSLLKKHERIHSRVRAPKETFVCDLCGEDLKRKSRLQGHQWRLHGVNRDDGEKFPCCSSCSYRCTSEKQLEDHMLRKHSTGEPNFICGECGKGYFGQSQLQSHTNSTHAKIKKYACDHCELKFESKGRVRLHIERNHTENRERKFKCSFCFKGFFDKIICQNHEKIHLEDRPFPCSQCDKRFPTKPYLKLHIYTIHENRKGRKRRKRVKKPETVTAITQISD